MPQYLKKGVKRGWVSEGFESLFDIDLEELSTSKSCTIIKDQKRIKVYRVEYRGTAIYIKRYNPYSLWSRLATIIQGSKALKAWQGANLLLEKGFNTAMPLAAIDYRTFGLIGKSFYVTKEISDSEISVHYYEDRFHEKKGLLHERRNFIRSMAKLFKELHQKGIYHNDLKDFNILIREDDGVLTPFLLDLEGVYRFKRVPQSKKIKNIVQLNRTIGRLMSKADRLAFILEYSEGKGWKELTRAVLKESERMDRKYGAKRL